MANIGHGRTYQRLDILSVKLRPPAAEIIIRRSFQPYILNRNEAYYNEYKLTRFISYRRYADHASF